MTIQECYTLLGGDYEEVLNRMYDEKRVQKFAFRFPEDTSFHDLCDAFVKGDDKTAFANAHTLKGLCANLGFKQLFLSSSAFTEALRNGRTDDVDALYEQIKQDYSTTVDALEKYKQQL